MKPEPDKKCAFKALFEKMEKLDHDMRDVKETLLRLKEQFLNPTEIAQIHSEEIFFTGDEINDD